LTPKQNKADTVEERHFIEAEYEKKQKATDWEEIQITGTLKRYYKKQREGANFAENNTHPPVEVSIFFKVLDTKAASRSITNSWPSALISLTVSSFLTILSTKTLQPFFLFLFFFSQSPWQLFFFFFLLFFSFCCRRCSREADLAPLWSMEASACKH
jgi:hypothetical protein